MVGNRTRLFAEHPDWVVKDRKTGGPLAPMTFYGEFRWHKRSEEYYVLDVTHPDAEAYIRGVFRTWAQDWGCGYFKTDFMHLRQHVRPGRARAGIADGLSRIEIWMRMARLIREEIGDALCSAAAPRSGRRSGSSTPCGSAATSAWRGRATTRPNRCCATRRRATSPTASCGRPTPTASCCATASTN